MMRLLRRWGTRPLRVCQDYGGFNLAVRDDPVALEEAGFFFGADSAEAVALIEANGPVGVGPGPDENGLVSEFAQVGEQEGANALLLVGGADIGVADEGDVVDVLDAHDSA